MGTRLGCAYVAISSISFLLFRFPVVIYYVTRHTPKIIVVAHNRVQITMFAFLWSLIEVTLRCLLYYCSYHTEQADTIVLI